MNVISELPMTVDTFLRWEGGGDFRWEFVNGRPIRLPRDGTREHMRLIMNLSFRLMSDLNAANFAVATSYFAVRTPDGIRIPDVVVDIAGGSGSDLAATAPVLIAEVTSEESRGRDLGEKRADYQGIESLRHYLVVVHDSHEILHWLRGPDGDWRGPIMHGGKPFNLPELGIAISDIWAEA